MATSNITDSWDHSSRLTDQSDFSLRHFLDPGALFRPIPLWSWNADLSPEETRKQVRQMAERQWGGFFMHTRVGLVTPYLSDTFFDLVRASVEEARETGLHAWIYDEDKWPSGYAGGLVPEESEEFRMKGISLQKVQDDSDEGASGGDSDDAGAGTMSDSSTSGEQTLREFTYENRRYAVVAKTGKLGDPWFNYSSYVDLMNTRTVERFLEITLDAYERAVGHEFGKTVPGIFTDEPCYLFFGYRNGYLPWTPVLPQFFQDRHGYDLIANLESLFLPIGEFRRVRYHFFDAATRLFADSFTRTYQQAAERRGLIFTGHFMSEDSLEKQTQWIGAAMPHYEYMTWPGIDKLERHVEEHITCKQVSSVADQLGKERTFCETYGGAGQHLTFEDRRWIYNWQAALGINVADPHLALYTMSGERKRDFPANLFYQQPWWEFENGINQYIGRLNYVLSKGKRAVDVLVLHPIATAWALYDIQAYQEGRESPIKPYDAHLYELTQKLLGKRLDFHFGDEIIMERHARIERGGAGQIGRTLERDEAAQIGRTLQRDEAGQNDKFPADTRPRFVIGHASYSVVVVPSSLTWREHTVRLLKDFSEAGGTVVFSGEVPQFQNMAERVNLPELLPGSRQASSIAEAIDLVQEATPAAVTLERTDLGSGEFDTESVPILVHRRILGKGREILFLTNADEHARLPVRIHMPGARGVTELDCETGEQYCVGQMVGTTERAADGDTPARTSSTVVETVFEPGAGHLYLLDRSPEGAAAPHGSFLNNAAASDAPKAEPKPVTTGNPAAPHSLSDGQATTSATSRPQPNAPDRPGATALELDQWRLSFESPNIMPVDRVTLRVSNRTVATDAPLHLLWDRHFLSLEDGTPFEAEYAFYLETVPPSGLSMAIERLTNLDGADLNGRPLPESSAHRLWNDPGLEVVDITGQAQPGWNRFVLRGHKINNITSGARGVGFHRRVPPELAPMYRPTELEAVYLLGDFVVRSQDNRVFWVSPETNASGTSRIAGAGGPYDTTLPVNISDTGRPFYAGIFLLETTYTIPPEVVDSPQGNSQGDAPDSSQGNVHGDAPGNSQDNAPGNGAAGPVLKLDGVTVPAVEVIVDGMRVATRLWAPWAVPLPAEACSPGLHTLQLRMPTDLFNLLGPNRAGSGYPTITGPDAFRRTDRWTEERVFLPRGIRSARLLWQGGALRGRRSRRGARGPALD